MKQQVVMTEQDTDTQSVFDSLLSKPLPMRELAEIAYTSDRPLSLIPDEERHGGPILEETETYWPLINSLKYSKPSRFDPRIETEQWYSWQLGTNREEMYVPDGMICICGDPSCQYGPFIRSRSA